MAYCKKCRKEISDELEMKLCDDCLFDEIKKIGKTDGRESDKTNIDYDLYPKYKDNKNYLSGLKTVIGLLTSLNIIGIAVMGFSMAAEARNNDRVWIIAGTIVAAIIAITMAVFMTAVVDMMIDIRKLREMKEKEDK